jgi:serine/threonine-protein kinase
VKRDAAEMAVLSKLLDEVLELDVDERPNWIEGLSEAFETLKPTLRKLLLAPASHETIDVVGFGRHIRAAVAGAATLADSLQLEAGARVGPYVLIREIGVGGMGRVWLGRRMDGQLNRRVALKLPFAGPLERELMARFARERDILAALTHPNIARLYDAGITEAGQAYLALEYVEGSSLTAFCNARHLPVGARLKLFLQVLQAVKYAHANLVIHRDLKPSNILVTDAGDVRLLDFGIAKLMIAGEARETALTQFTGRALTPDYASPEQIAGAPLNISSDVYSLGVLLYELLTGERPYRLSRDSRAALEEAILASDPVRPSQAIRDEQKAAAAGLSVAKLRRVLAGDLDTIVLKTLRKKPAERYATVDAFLQDIERHQAGQPVLARPDSALYRFGKFVARNRFAMGGALMGALVLLGATVLSLRQARIAREQATLAQGQARRAQAVQGFLLDIFRANTHLQPDPLKARQTTAREMLDIGTERIGESLKNVPDAQAEVLATLGDMYTQMGLKNQASKLRLQRIAALKKARGPLDVEVAEALLDYVEDISTTRERVNSPPALQEAQRILDAAGDDSSEIRAEWWMEYGRFYQHTAPDKMREFEDNAVRLLERDFRDTWTYPLALELAAQARFELGAYDGAETLYRETLAEVHRREPGASAWDVAPLARIAGAQAALLKIGEAEQNFRASLSTTEKLNGKSHMETLQSGSRLGAFLHATSRRAEGRRLLESALTEIDHDPGKQGSAVAATVNGLYGQSLLADGRIETAEKFLALNVADTRDLYPGSALLAKGLLLQGELFTALGRYAEADRALTEAASIRREVGGAAKDAALENPFLIDQAWLALAQGDVQAAIELAQRVRQPVNATRLPLLVDEVAAGVVLATAYGEQKRTAQALLSAHAALDAVQRSPLRDYFQSIEANAALALGEALRRSGDARSALLQLELALKLRAANDDPGSPWLARTKVALAECLLDLGKRGRAATLFGQASASDAAHASLGVQFRQPLHELAVRIKGAGGNSR